MSNKRIGIFVKDVTIGKVKIKSLENFLMITYNSKDEYEKDKENISSRLGEGFKMFMNDFRNRPRNPFCENLH